MINSILEGVWGTHEAAFSLFSNDNMAAVTSCKKTLHIAQQREGFVK